MTQFGALSLGGEAAMPFNDPPCMNVPAVLESHCAAGAIVGNVSATSTREEALHLAL